jgi:nucleoside-diphosphate-sugar epimerase
VFHLAAYAAEGLSPFIRNYNYQNNLVATANIVNECIKHDVKRLVFTSTLAVYGHGEGGMFDEVFRPAPIDPYGVAKFGCEMDIQIAGEQHGLDWCIIRPHNVYGIKQNIWDKYRNVLGIWMYQHMNGESTTIFGDGEQTRAFSYVDDILEPMWNAAILPQASKEIINLGGIEEHTINEANKILSEIAGSMNTTYHEQRHEVKHSIPTWKKSVEELVRNQGAYKSYCKAKRRVKTNHKNAYAHVEFKFESYEQFLKELGPRPEGSSLDRIDPKGNYEPGNVRWATQAKQNRNKRNNVFVVYEGKKMCLKDAAKITGKDRNALKRRIETGCPSEFLFQDGKWCSKTQKFFPTDTAK